MSDNDGSDVDGGVPPPPAPLAPPAPPSDPDDIVFTHPPQPPGSIKQSPPREDFSVNGIKSMLLRCATLSKHAYLSPEDTRRHRELAAFIEDQVPGFPIFITDDDTDAQVYVWIFKSTGEAVIAYRGTDSKKDMAIDLDLQWAEFPVHDDDFESVLVHRGFLRQFSSVVHEIHSLLTSYRSEFHTIVSTGHSLGGGLASLSAVRLAEDFGALIHRCVTFGCPRVGNEEFVMVFRKLVHTRYRIVNQEDPVPMSPPFKRFLHVHDAVNITDELTVRTVDDPTSIRKRIVRNMKDVDWSINIATDHHMTLYHDRLKFIFRAAGLPDPLRMHQPNP